MKSVLISIRPKWCELIASGEKTVEVRKTRPKTETPFKCYIYKTVDGRTNSVDVLENNLGKVIGAFVCDEVHELKYYYCDGADIDDDLLLETTLVREDINIYAGGKTLYGWHISDVKIYDAPKELSEFIGLRKTKFGFEPVAIKRPPQSWCYVEDYEMEERQ